MPRYLTPYKICLLLLTDLYTDAVVPNDATIPVLSVLVSHLIPKHAPSASGAGANNQSEPSAAITDFEKALRPLASRTPGRTVYDLFLETLWDLDSLDALHAFFNELPELFKGPAKDEDEDAEPNPDEGFPLSRTSPLGAFVRRSRLEFIRLQFQDTVDLWGAFRRFREPTLAAFRKRHPAGEQSERWDINVSQLSLMTGEPLLEIVQGKKPNNEESEDGMISAEDTERMLEFQIDKLQKLGNRVPDDMKKQIEKIVQPSGKPPSLVHFVRFFDSWRAGDYTTSFDNLHRYFDYTMHNRDKSYYQYALLHMAILQADFGCFGEAIAAMNETIAVARENQDMSCLNFSLSWLNHLRKAYPQEIKGTGYGGMLGNEKDGLVWLKNKAKEGKMWTLLSSTLLGEAKLELTTGESIPHAFEHIYQSSHLNVHYNIPGNYGAQLLMQSSIYGRLGVNSLSSAYTDILRHAYANRGILPVEESLHATCRAAISKSQSGAVNEALDLIRDVPKEWHRTLNFHNHLRNSSGLIKLERAIWKRDTVASEHLLHQLKASTSTDSELDFSVSALEIRHLMQTDDLSSAFTKLSSLISQQKEENTDIFFRVHLLTLKAKLWAAAGKPERGFSVAVRAVSTALRVNILPAVWDAVGAVANILNELEEYHAASELLESAIPQALGTGDLALCAELYSFLADSCMGLAGKEEAGSRERAKWLGRTDIYLDRALKLYGKIEFLSGQCDILYKKSLIAKLRGDDQVATDWASQYLSTYERAVKEMSLDDGAVPGAAREQAEE